MKTICEAELKAFALGYYDGRTEGVERDPYVADNLRHMYRRGYDAGIADYSAIVEDPFTGRAYIKGETA